MALSDRVTAKFSALLIVATVLLFNLIVTDDIIAQQIHLNEVMASNSTTIADEDGEFGDWIEIYNSGDLPLSLAGYGLSDNYNNPYKWVFPDTTLEAGAFILIWATNKDRTIPGAELHTNFAISAAGEEIILTDPDGTRVDELEPAEIPTDISIGRKPDGTSDWVFFDEPTPGAPNLTDPLLGLLEPPNFSHQQGFYNESFDLSVTHPEEDVTIYYTLDGSTPTDQSEIYNCPLTIEDRSLEPNDLSTIPSNFKSGWRRFILPAGPVKKGTIVKTLAVKNGYEPVISKRSYFVFPDGSDTHQLPVISISTDRDNLFGYDEGIYVPGVNYVDGDDTTGNYYMRGIEWEREAGFEYFSENGEFQFGQNVGLRIHGGYSRRLTQKSFRVYARNQYGESRIKYPIFKNQGYDSYNRLLLRNSGNDLSFSMFRDAAAHQIVNHLNMDTQAHQPSIVYINGEYWGLHNIRERYDRHYLERVYGIDPDRIDLLTREWDVVEGDNQEYAALITFIANENLGNQQNYEYVKTRIDIDNFLDYYVSKIFFVNTDWPHNNIDFWRSKTGYNPDAPTGHDGRWRWLFYDVDFTFGLVQPADFDMMSWVTAARNFQNRPWPNRILRNLLQNEEFTVDFINRTADHLNTTFRPDRMHTIMDSLKAIIEPEMTDYIERWRYPTSLEVWENTVTGMKGWASDRPAHHRENVMNHFSIDSLAIVTIDEYDLSKGRLKLNSLLIQGETPGIDQDPFPWSGIYFSGIPITVKAEPLDDYQFSHWEINDQIFTSSTITLLPDTTDTIRVFFEEFTLSDPEVLALTEDDYSFEYFGADSPRGVYPEGMRFVYMNDMDPGLESEIEGYTTGKYDLTSRTRINGLGESGFSFINTSNPEGNPGYPGGKLGGAVLYLNTEERSFIEVGWTAGTMEPNSRVYNIRLQYRVGRDGEFKDVLNSQGAPVEYQRSAESGHTETFGPTVLPAEVKDQKHVEILWRYYYTGERIDEESGQRSQLRISEISVTSKPVGYEEEPDPDPLIPNSFNLYQNYPNPFHPISTIVYDLPKPQYVKLEIYSISGQFIKTVIDREVQAGRHSETIDVSNLASGIYLYRLTTNEYNKTLRMTVIK